MITLFIPGVHGGVEEIELTIENIVPEGNSVLLSCVADSDNNKESKRTFIRITSEAMTKILTR